jgi:fibronectin-binding autotransporter adhesin
MTFSRDFVVNPGGSAFNNDGNRDISLTGLISGDGAFTIGSNNGNNGITRLRQTGANTFTSGLVVTNGLLEFSRNDQLGAQISATDYDSGQIVLNETGTTNATLRLANGSGTVTTTGHQFNMIANPRIEVAGASDRLIIDDEIRGAGGFTKGGAGTLILTAPRGNGYAGTTTVAFGALLANSPTFSSTGSGAVSISGGATLGGNGVIDGTITGTAGSFLSPGPTIDAGNAGILRGENGLILQSDATYKWSLAALSTSNPGVDFDRFIMEAGALSINSGADFKFDFGTGIAPSADAFWKANHLWEDIIRVNAPGTIAAAGFFDLDNTPYQAFGEFSIVSDASGYDLIWTAVPEPGSVTLLLGGVAVAASRRKRQRPTA